jgi:hypothetical protein
MDLLKKINAIKNKTGINIIWRGVHYDWLINYENWFYVTKGK